MRLTISILFALSVHLCNGQQFSVLYDNDNHSNDGSTIRNAPFGYLTTHLALDIFTWRYNTLIAGFDFDGQLLFDTSLTTDDTEFSQSKPNFGIVPVTELGYYWVFGNWHVSTVVGCTPFLCKVSHEGETEPPMLFEEISGVDIRTLGGARSATHLFILCNYYSTSTVVIIKSDLEGNYISHFTSPIGFQSDSKFITDVGDGLVIGGRYLPNAVSNISIQYVRKLDYDGNVLWTYHYNNNGLSSYGAVNALALDNRNILFASSHSQGDPDMLRFQPYIGEIDDLTGDTLWTKRYLNPDSTNRLHNFKRLSSGEYIGVGETFQYSPGIAALPYVTMAYIMKLDSEFNLLWYRYYTPTGYVGGPFLDPVCHLNDFVENEDGGITALGRAFTYTGTGLQSGYVQDSWLLRVDSEGCLVSGCAVDVTEYEKSSELYVYPNPASDRLHIAFPHIDKWHVSIYNMQGALVREGQPHQLLHYTMDVQALPSGVYTVLSRDSQGKTFSHKIIKH
jgi:hypothetical protein